MCCRMYGRKDVFRKNNWGRDIEPGGSIPFRTAKGTYVGIWGGVVKPGEHIQGHAREDKLESYWLKMKDRNGKKIWHEVEIPGIKLFSERNTVLKNGEVVRFTVPDGHVIKAIARQQDIGKGKKILDVRVVTEPAEGAVKGIHHRQPMIREATHPDA